MEYFRFGIESFAAIKKLIEEANREILISTYNFSNDRWGWEFAQALRAKAETGVPVRLLVDALGSHGHTNQVQYWFAGSKVELKLFKPLPWLLRHPVHYFCRNHVRIFLFDRKFFGTGGIGLGRTYAPREDFFTIQELNNGEPIARDFELLWKLANAKPNISFTSEEDSPIAENLSVTVSGALLNKQVLYRAWLDKFDSARQRITIVSPFFLPTKNTLIALAKAAQRGVEINIITPGHTDRPYYDGLRQLAFSLLNSDTRVWLTPHYFHQKFLIIDDSWSVGSANFDILSTHRNYELNLSGRGGEMLNVLDDIAADNQTKTGTTEYRAPVHYWNLSRWAYPLMEYLLAKVRLL